MNTKLCIAITLTSLCGLATAQDDAAAKKATATRYASLDSIIGANVQLSPTWEQKKEARKDGEKAKGPKGAISDIIVDADSGDLEWAIVEFGGGIFGIGGKTVAVPFTSMTHHQKDETIVFHLGASEKELDQLAAFNLDAARERGIDTTVEIAERSWIRLRDPKKAGEAKGNAKGKVKDANVEKTEGDAVVLAGKAFVAYPSRFICASKLDDHKVFARSEEFGGISSVLIQCDKPRVEFLVVGHGGVAGIGGTNYLVPFNAASMRCCKENEKEVAYRVDRSKEQMKNCVEYKKPKKGVLDPDVERAARKKFADKVKGGQ